MFITRITIYTIVVVAFAALVTLIPSLQHPDPESAIYKLSSGLFLLSNAGIAVSMYQNGYTHKTKHTLYLQFTMCLLLIGYIMRGTEANQPMHITNVALIAIAPIYLMSYLSKKDKYWADHGKLVYVFSFCALGFLRDNKLYDNLYVTLATQVLLWCLFADTTRKVLKRERETMLKTAEIVDVEAEIIK